MSMFLTVLMFIRVHLIVRLIPNLSQWTDRHSEECCEREGFEATFSFALKSLLKQKPYRMLLINFAISIICLGFAVRNFERAFYEDSEFGTIKHDSEWYQNYGYVWNSFWLVVVTMTTVGFGDLYPVTHMGRLIMVISVFWGMFLVSQFVYTL